MPADMEIILGEIEHCILHPNEAKGLEYLNKARELWREACSEDLFTAFFSRLEGGRTHDHE